MTHRFRAIRPCVVRFGHTKWMLSLQSRGLQRNVGRSVELWRRVVFAREEGYPGGSNPPAGTQSVAAAIGEMSSDACGGSPRRQRVPRLAGAWVSDCYFEYFVKALLRIPG